MQKDNPPEDKMTASYNPSTGTVNIFDGTDTDRILLGTEYVVAGLTGADADLAAEEVLAAYTD